MIKLSLGPIYYIIVNKIVINIPTYPHILMIAIQNTLSHHYNECNSNVLHKSKNNSDQYTYIYSYILIIAIHIS